MHRFLLTLAVLFGLCSLGAAQAVSTAQRSSIRVATAAQTSTATVPNQATMVCNDPRFHQLTTVPSNLVQAQVQYNVPFTIKKTTANAHPLPGTEIGYTIQLSRNAKSSASPMSILLDGSQQLLFLLSDAIPSRTVFVRANAGGAGLMLYHVRGSPAGSYVSHAPHDLSTVDIVGVGFTALPVGSSHSLSLTLRSDAKAAGAITNTAYIQFINHFGAADYLASAVAVTLQGSAPHIVYYNQGFQHVVSVSHLGDPLYIQVTSALMNTDPKVVDRGTVTLTSSITGDTEVVQVVETGPDTGIFRSVSPIPTRSGQQYPASPGNGILETVANDTIVAVVNDPLKQRATANILIDPAGIVFDSSTNLPVAGAKVTLINVGTGLPATVYGYDGTTIYPSSVTTGSDGRYTFPAVAAGSYELKVVPPAGYTFASTVTPSKLPAGRVIDVNGSYGSPFNVSSSIGAVVLDIPVDENQSGSTGLFVEKTASRTTVEVGDFLNYSVNIKNVSKVSLRQVVLTDTLPYGFIYVKGTARFKSGQKLADPTTARGVTYFTIGQVDPDVSVTVDYRVRVTVGAQQGDGINRAQAYDCFKTSVRSNVASARVEITAGVFTTDGIIFGKIFVDLNRNKIQDEGPVEIVSDGKGGPDRKAIVRRQVEPGVPGVRLYLEDGSYVITDADGKFSFYGIHARLHVLKVDKTTLPKGARLEVISSNNAGDPRSLFVDLKDGEMHKADFALLPSPAVVENVLARKTAAEDAVSEVEANLRTPLTQQGSGATSSTLVSSGIVSTSQAGNKAMPSSGILGVGTASSVQASGISTATDSSVGLSNAASDAAMPRMEQASSTPWTGSLLQNRIDVKPDFVPHSTGFVGNNAFPVSQPPFNSAGQGLIGAVAPGLQTASPGIPLETALSGTGIAEFGFIDLHDKETLTMDQSTIRVRGNAAARLALIVNGVEVPESRIGKKIVSQKTQSQAIEYISVPLKPGENRLELVQRDSFGNVRGQQAITVIAPDRLGKIVIELPKVDARADGKTPVRVVVRLLDAKGVPVSARTEITLDSSIGEWAVQDLNPKVPGVQVFIEGGRGEYFLKPPLQPADAVVRVSVGAMHSQVQLPFLPELRPFIAAGVVEGQVNFRSLDSSFGRRQTYDSFSETLTQISTSNSNDATQFAAHTAFFAKGQVTGEYVLTAAYDSEKKRGERLFRDVQPDDFYPIYGDSSLKGFDAQSTSAAYVKIENRKSYLLYGDFTTESNTEARTLGNYSRSLTGAKYHYEDNHLQANAWGAYDRNRQVVVEINANGTSGPYAFQAVSSTGLMNSEKVEILTRDRNQTSVILKTVSMSRFSDYEFEPFNGRILFKTPIPTLDENLNPVSIRITYEIDQGGAKFWVYGGDAQVRLTNWMEVGGSFAKDENPMAPVELYSANAIFRMSKNTYLVGEAAQSDTPLKGTGEAVRFDFRHTGQALNAHVYWGRADANFDNQTSSLSAGRIEGGADVTYRLNEKLNLHLQALDSESTSGGSRRGVLGEAQYSFANRIRLDIGSRFSTEKGDPYAASGSTNDTTAATTVVSSTTSEPNLATIRAKLTVPFPFLNNGSLYGEYENDLNQIQRRMAAVGMEYQANEKTKVYLKHEFITSLGGAFDLNTYSQKNTTVVGVQSEYMKNGNLFNEYRMNDATSGREAEAAIGLRNSWTIADGLRVQGTFERVAPVAIFGRGRTVTTSTVSTATTSTATNTGTNSAFYNGTAYDSGAATTSSNSTGAVGTNNTVALTGAFDYTPVADWKLTGRGEFRTSDTEDSVLATFGYARKINEDWSVLGKVLFYDVTATTSCGTDEEQFRFQFGFAYRPAKVNIWNALAKYELRLENGSSSTDSAADRTVHIVSADVNWQPRSFFTVSGHLAAKYAEDHTDGINSSEFAALFGLRALIDIGSRWDAGFNARVMMDQTGRCQYGVGPEVGFRVYQNVRIAAGYNVFGLKDADLTDDDYTEQGPFITLRMKFDENLLSFGKKDEEDGK